MSFYKSFAIVGFGGLGAKILAEFVKGEQQQPRGYRLCVLTRESSKDKTELSEYAKKGVEIMGVDYSSLDSITYALQGMEIVFSTLRGGGLEEQANVIRAAKTASVKVFVPSEYGTNTFLVGYDYQKAKTRAHALLKELGLPYALFFIGFMPETVIEYGQYLALDFVNGRFDIFGDGNVPISWTSPPSIATYVHHVFTTLPPSELENRVFKIEGDRKSWREIVALWEVKHKKKAQVHYMTEEEIRDFQAAQNTLYPVFMSNAHRDRDAALTGGEDNALWMEWNPLKWEDIMP